MRDACDGYTNLYRIRWLISHYWLMGIRNFTTNYLTGSVTYYLQNQQDPNGQLRLLFEDVVVKVQEELGRLNRADVRPSTAPRGHGLDRIRKASAGRVILDYLSSSFDLDKIKESVFYHLVVYGTVGLQLSTRSEAYPGLDTYQEGEAQGGRTEEVKACLEVVPTWELYPIPANPDAPEDVQGILRKRWVPYSWVKKQRKLKLPADGPKDGRLQAQSAPYGAKPKSAGTSVSPMFEESVRTVGLPLEPKIKAGEDETDYVLLEEYFFLHEEKDRLCRWIVKIGDYICADHEYKDYSVYCPISVARYHPIGGFYGRSFVEILIPLNAECELMLANLCQNVKDLDLYGILMIPNNYGVSKNEILRRDRTRKVCFYDPDITMDAKERAFALNPVNSNDFPGKVVALANQMMDRLTRQSDLMRGEAPGRVDSYQALGFLNEMANIPLSVPANSVASMFGQIYKALLAAAPDLLSEANEVPLIGLDDSIVGLIVKPNTGKVVLRPENFPLPSEVEVGIRDRLPSPPTVRIQKLLDAHQRRLLSDIDFKITVWRENLDYPVGSWDEQEAYRKSVLMTILLFGDGENPGQVIPSTEADNPKIALRVIQQFMAKPEFTFVSKKVREAFEELKRVYQNMIGSRYPDPLMHPEDEAMMAQSMLRGGPGGMGPPGPPR